MKKDSIESAYLEDVLDVHSLRKVVRQLKKKLLPHTDKFDTIAFRGVSGCMIGPLLAVALNKRMVVVRKIQDNCHSSREVEGYKDAHKYIIVDDLIASGETLSLIKKQMYTFTKYNANFAKCVGIVLYANSSLASFEEYVRENKIRKVVGLDPAELILEKVDYPLK